MIEKCLDTQYLHQRLCETGSFDVHKPNAGHQRTIRILCAEESILQEYFKLILQQVHALCPKTSIFPSLSSGTLFTTHTKVCILLIFNSSRHWNGKSTISAWNLSRGLQEKTADRNFTANVLFADETVFSLEDVMNDQNCLFLARTLSQKDLMVEFILHSCKRFCQTC